MKDGGWLATILGDTPAKIEAWKNQAVRLKHLVTIADVTGQVSDDLLRTAEDAPRYTRKTPSALT